MAVQLDWLLALRSRSGDASSRDGYDATHKALWRAKMKMASLMQKAQLAAKDTSKWDESSHMRDERIVRYLVLSTCVTSGWWAS